MMKRPVIGTLCSEKLKQIMSENKLCNLVIRYSRLGTYFRGINPGCNLAVPGEAMINTLLSH
jgi:hypothetical protein